jgi:hypothetical protein
MPLKAIGACKLQSLENQKAGDLKKDPQQNKQLFIKQETTLGRTLWLYNSKSNGHQ